jgi:hypothetical protein
LLGGLGEWVQVELVLNQFPRDSKHVNRLPCKDVLVFLDEFDEHKFLFGIQGVAYVSNLGRFLCRQRGLFAKCVLRLDGLLGVLGIRHDRVSGGDSANTSFSSCSSVDAANLSAISHLSLSQS